MARKSSWKLLQLQDFLKILGQIAATILHQVPLRLEGLESAGEDLCQYTPHDAAIRLGIIRPELGLPNVSLNPVDVFKQATPFRIYKANSASGAR